jgi:hypothetical protein
MGENLQFESLPQSSASQHGILHRNQSCQVGEAIEKGVEAL